MADQRRPWTAEDLADLERRYARGQTFLEISEALNRSRGNCVIKAHLLNLPPRDRREQCTRGYDMAALRRAAELGAVVRGHP